MATPLKTLIDSAQALIRTGRILADARNETRSIRVQVTSRWNRPTSYIRIDVWELPSGRKMPKSEWSKEL
jgi:hypothetical protein